MTIYDKSGQPYDADVVEGEDFRALRQQNATLALSNRLLDDENSTLRKLNQDVTRDWSIQVWLLRNEASRLADELKCLASAADKLAGRGPAGQTENKT